MGTRTLSEMFSAGDLKELVAAGHEIGCHTFHHCHSWDTHPAVFEESIIENKRALNRLMPDTSFKTFSFPMAWPRPKNKLRAAKHYVGCRSGGQTFNVGTADINNLKGYFLEQSRDDPTAVERVIEMNSRSRGWLIFATHDISELPSYCGCRPAFFEAVVRQAVASGATILPVVEALQAATGRRLSEQG